MIELCRQYQEYNNFTANDNLSAEERALMASKSSNSSASIGLGFGSGGVTIDLAANGMNGGANGTDITHSESLLTAANNVTLITNGKLLIQGGKVTGDGVNIKAANLELISQQDTSVYSSQYKNWGVNASFAINGTPQSFGLNGGIEKQSGTFASVNEQSGIYAGNAGYNIIVVGNTNLVGAVIASSADKDKNYLSTGTLTASDIENHEKYNATSVNVGFSITNTPTTNADGTKGSKAKLSASLPTAMSASGDQSSTTKSAIADGTIIITSNDTASLQTAATISHDTEGANQPLTKQYNDQMRADIADGFRATKALAGEVNTFLQNRETEKETVKKEAETGIGRDGHVLTDEERQTALETYIHLENTYGSNKPGTIALTALTGAASGNVTGSMNSLAQAVTINVVQSICCFDFIRDCMG